jgi:3-phosphoshikimate 1-carboxyvinyltransferase
MSTNPLAVAPLLLPFDAELVMPGSKSHANRAIICACLAKGATTITNATPCDDVALLVKNLQKIGFQLEWKEKTSGTIEVRGGIPKKGRTATLDCGNAGTTLRFLTSLACIVPGTWTITGDAHMQKRPIGDLVKALKQLGAEIEDTKGCPPIKIKGGTLKEGSTTLDASKSSQFLTSLLLIEPALMKPLTIKTRSVASPKYVELTKQVLEDFGNQVPKQYEIEGDWSAAGAFLVLAELSQSRIRFSNLEELSKQADKHIQDAIEKMKQKGDMTINCNNIPDQVMNLAILAAHRKGTTKITGAANLSLKECDRLAVITKELKKLGIRIKEHSDGVIIQGGNNIKSALLDPHDDHRMVFAFAILGSLHSGIKIKNPECVSKSYPNFFQDLKKLHQSPRCIAIIGMRGCGKSNLGKKLANKLKLKRIDTDAVFEKKHGKIGAFVQKRGWKPFRDEEEKIVAASLKSGYVVSLGGGAIESAQTRKNLMSEATVIWMQASARQTIQRLKKTKRPALTKMSLEQEVKTVLKKRDPLYKSVAAINLPERTPFSKQIPFLVRALHPQK